MILKMKDGQKLKLGDVHVTPRHIQKVQSSKLGDVQGIPFFINKNIRSFLNTLYFYCFIFYVLFLERLVFLFSVCLVFFDVINSSILEFLCGRDDTLRFNCIEHSSFHSYCSMSVLFLLVLRLAPVFHASLVQSLLVLFIFVFVAL